jgi:hypothetical protein
VLDHAHVGLERVLGAQVIEHLQEPLSPPGAVLTEFALEDLHGCVECSLPIPTKLLRVQVQDLVEVIVDVGTVRLDTT